MHIVGQRKMSRTRACIQMTDIMLVLGDVSSPKLQHQQYTKDHLKIMLCSASVPRILQIAEIQFLREVPNANVFQVRKLMHQELHKSHYQGDSDEDGDVLSGVSPTEA